MPKPVTSAERVIAKEREAQAFELRKSGANYRQIGDHLGVTPQAAHKMVKRVMAMLAKLAKEDAEAVRQMELDRLDAMLMGLWPKARKGNEGAVDRVIRIMQRRADMLGIDAPKRSELTGKDGKPIQTEQRHGGLSDEMADDMKAKVLGVKG